MPACQRLERRMHVVQAPGERFHIRGQFTEKIIPVHRYHRVGTYRVGGFLHEHLLIMIRLFAQAGAGQQGIVSLVTRQRPGDRSGTSLNQQRSGQRSSPRATPPDHWC